MAEKVCCPSNCSITKQCEVKLTTHHISVKQKAEHQHHKFVACRILHTNLQICNAASTSPCAKACIMKVWDRAIASPGYSMLLVAFFLRQSLTSLILDWHCCLLRARGRQLVSSACSQSESPTDSTSLATTLLTRTDTTFSQQDRGGGTLLPCF